MITLFIAIISTLLLSFNIDKVFIFLAHVTWDIAHLLGFHIEPVQIEPDAFPFWDSTMMVLSIIAMVLMTRNMLKTGYCGLLSILLVLLFLLARCFSDVIRIFDVTRYFNQWFSTLASIS